MECHGRKFAWRALRSARRVLWSYRKGVDVLTKCRSNGGADLARLPGLARLIHVVPTGDPKAVRFALVKALDEATGKGGAADYGSRATIAFALHNHS